MPEMRKSGEFILRQPILFVKENYLSIGVFMVLLYLAAMAGPILQSLEQIETTETSVERNDSWKELVEDKTPEKATLAGGCFWCIEAVYDQRKGVESAVSGYTGGRANTATYNQVSLGNTEHREAVEVKYYPSIISYSEVLDIYWRSIDPTDEGGQFSDRGYQYTTAIYAHDTEQYRLALHSKQNLSDTGKFDEPIVTEILNATEFYVAEDYHQNYSRKNTASYKAYEKASGRAGYVERKWGEN